MSAYLLPIIDLRELDNPETRDSFYQKLRFMTREIGFFILLVMILRLNNVKIY